MPPSHQVLPLPRRIFAQLLSPALLGFRWNDPDDPPCFPRLWAVAVPPLEWAV